MYVISILVCRVKILFPNIKANNIGVLDLLSFAGRNIRMGQCNFTREMCLVMNCKSIGYSWKWFKTLHCPMLRNFRMHHIVDGYRHSPLGNFKLRNFKNIEKWNRVWNMHRIFPCGDESTLKRRWRKNYCWAAGRSCCGRSGAVCWNLDINWAYFCIRM